MCGKYVVGGAEEDEEALRRILATGRENGAEDLALVSGEELARREPRVKAHVALFSPRTGIVDSHGFMASLLAEARRAGSDVAFRHRLLGVARVGGGYELAVAAGGDSPTTVSAPRVVNAAGLESDTVAALAGIDVDAAGYRLVYVKGHYFRLQRAGLASSLIYPVPQPKLLGLGIHLTLDLGGGARLGPDTEILPDRHVDYRVPEALSTKFWEAARRYLPELQPDDLVPDQSGLRPRLARPQGAVPDFVVEEEAARGLPGWVNLVGIESPGLTSALAIANDVVALVE
jgi:L-2-hydroxyglutarate oxidase LhgO